MTRARQVANFDPALFAADEVSGDKVSGGTISTFASTGIDDDANALAITIDSSERVGIGDTTPQGLVEINNRNVGTGCALFIKGGEDDLDPISGQYTGLAFGYGAGDIYNNTAIIHEFTSAAAAAKLHLCLNTATGDGTPLISDAKLTLSGSNVGIGVTSPDDCKLHIQEGDSGGTGHSLAQLCIESSVYAGISMLSATNVACYIFFGDSDASNDGVINYQNNSRVMSFITADTTGMTISASQVVSGDLNDTSDIALKENIITLSSGELSKINSLRPVSFDWKKEGKGSTVGFIAQEVEEIFPTEVNGEDYDDTSDDGVNIKSIGKSINTIGIVAHLTKAVQELSAKVTALENA